MTPAPRRAERSASGPADFLQDFDLSSRQAIVVAVSGGSDSTALLYLARDWRERMAPSVRLVAATVDHGLRPESAAEAASVAALCTRLSIDHVILRWTGQKPATGLQAAAREARLRLLAGAAIRARTDVVLAGHTLDDQAETVAMRAGRGPGVGLAGMAPATLVDGGVWIVRPLLQTRREALRDFLRNRGVAWIDDPSNDNPAFERVRLRRSAPAIDPGQIAAASHARCDLAERAAALLDAHASTPSRGLVRLDPALFAAADRDAAVHAFRALLAALGGVEHLPDAARAAALFDRVRPPLRATLSRTVVDARRAGVFLHRESRGLPGPAEAADGMVWDGRFRLRLAGLPGPVVVPMGQVPMGRAPADGAPMPVDAVAPASLVRAALAAEPALDDGRAEAEGAMAPLDETSSPVAATRLALPWSRLLPSFDLPLARSVARAVGAPPFRSPPCHGHKAAKA